MLSIGFNWPDALIRGLVKHGLLLPQEDDDLRTIIRGIGSTSRLEPCEHQCRHLDLKYYHEFMPFETHRRATFEAEGFTR